MLSREARDQFVAHASGGSLLQSSAWQEFQETLGRQTFVVTTGPEDAPRGFGMFIVMPIWLGRSYLYCPRGPLFTLEATTADYKNFWEQVAAKAKEHKAIFVRIDPGVASEPSWLTEYRFRHIDGIVQPTTTTILDLTQSLDELLNNTKPKTRYNIRLAAKKDVVVRHSTDVADLEHFRALNIETQTRDAFKAHSEGYYRTMFTTLVPSGNLHLFVAEVPALNKVLAVNIVTVFGDMVTYLHGASSNEERNRMAPFAAQWEAIRWAKEQGYKHYDFWGITPSEDPQHPWAGITRFKKGFNGPVVQYIGTYDQPTSALWYGLYRIAKKVF